MNNWTVGRKIYTGFGGLLAVVVFGVGTSMLVASSLNAALDDAVSHITEIKLTWKLSDTVTGLLGQQRDALLQAARPAGGSTTPIDASRLERELDELKAALPDDEEKQRVDEARSLLHAWLQVHDEALRLARDGRHDEALDIAASKGDALLAEAETIVGQLLAGHDASVAGLERHAEALKVNSDLAQLAVLILTAVIGLGVAWVVRGVTRSLQATTEELRAGAQQVAAAAEQVSTSAQALSEGATEQAASLEETSASMEELAAMTRQNADNSGQAAGLMAEVDGQVARSNEALTRMVASMSGIQESSTRVSKIIKTIDEIAFQTNILALNAAVEAARAGEAGMGFAVVADEVRNLAQRSAQAARDTTDLIEESSRNAQSGAATLDLVAGSIAEITTSVNRVKALVDQVSAASRQQTQGIDQVTQAVSQMEKVTQTTAATAEESAAASEELNAQAETTMHAVSELSRLVGQARAVSPRPPAASRPPAAAATLQVVAKGRRAPQRAASAAEAALPLEDTGTFGRF
ncbi:MAG: hypothetical protein KJ066_19270 [Acidobacteria bacterium]|nr:hypothetical protein [Acidobacteriota bacterium]